MTQEQKQWFEKGRLYEEQFAEAKAEEKYESLIICLLEQNFRGGEGETFVSDLDLSLAQRRYISFMKKDLANNGIKIKLVKEINPPSLNN